MQAKLEKLREEIYMAHKDIKKGTPEVSIQHAQSVPNLSEATSSAQYIDKRRPVKAKASFLNKLFKGSSKPTPKIKVSSVCMIGQYCV